MGKKLEDQLLQIFGEETSGNQYVSGQRVVNNDLVASTEIKVINGEDIVLLEGIVISEDLFHEYGTRLELETSPLHIRSAYCSCKEYEEKSGAGRKMNYCCKHLVGTFYKAVEELAIHPLVVAALEREPEYVSLQIQRDEGRESLLLEKLIGEPRSKEEARLEVCIGRDAYTGELYADFRIGTASMGSSGYYVVKDLGQFLQSINDNIPMECSKSFMFHPRKHYFTPEQKKVIDFVEMLGSLGERKTDSRASKPLVQGKFVHLPDYLVREFISMLAHHRVYLHNGFFGRPVEVELFLGRPEVEFDLKIVKELYVLKAPDGMPESLCSNAGVLLYGTTVYLPETEYSYVVMPYLDAFAKADVVTFGMEQQELILRELIPRLRGLSKRVVLSGAILKKVVISEAVFKFYFDRENNVVQLSANVVYGEYELNLFEDEVERIIYRDLKREKEVAVLIQHLGFERNGNRFYLSRGDDFCFRFFKSEIKRLQEAGEVYYSERFKGLRHIGASGIIGTISPGKFNYFEMGFKIRDIAPVEVRRILRAFRDNLKYYRLENGEFLDLEELKLKAFLKLLDAVAHKGMNGETVEIPHSRAPFVESYLESAGLRFIAGSEALTKVSEKLNRLSTAEFICPEGLEAVLRDYQKTGYQWFRTMDYLGFGGILSDEMGLGKTLQAISYIAGNGNGRKKTLIITPTSLVYHWVDEFEKFAGNIDVVPVCGSPLEREQLIGEFEQHDVFITTYHLLRRDQEWYRSLSFDICLLDEAQFIKNAHAQNTKAVKSIQARVKFALTGTPLENSLMELWSIFDFVLPGYLYDERRFSVRYHKRLKEEPEVLEDLHRLIKPFILRRTKREVLKELPEKIETKQLVSMHDEQAILYKTYANYAVQLIEKKVADEEFEASKLEILAYLTKLRQICLDPSIVMEDYKGSSGKLEALYELLAKGLDQQHKMLVFSQFTTVLGRIEKHLKKEGMSYFYLDGSTPSEKRMQLTEEFNLSGPSVFLISLKAGGTGLNLATADVVIHFDPWWNPAVEDQATDRAHRIGQTNVVEVIRIIAKGTIEEKILLLQEEKRKLIGDLLSTDLTDGESLLSLNDEEMLQLFQ